MKERYNIVGMSCASCAANIERKYNDQEDINATVNLLTNSIDIEYDSNKYDFDKLKNILDGTHFTLIKKINRKDRKELHRLELNNIRKKMYLSLLFTIPIIILSMGDMIGIPINIFPISINILIQFLLTSIVIYIGYYIIEKGIKNLVSKMPTMESLISIGVISSYIYGIYATINIFLGHIEYIYDIYFESASVIITLVILGKYLENKVKDKSNSAINNLMSLTPKKVMIYKNNKEILVDIDKVNINDIVIIKQGDSIATDGIVVKGSAYVDESMLTGESNPILKKVGDKLIAGTVNVDGYLEYKTEAIAQDTVLEKIIDMVENAQESKLPIAKFADKISYYFVPIIIMIAILTGIVWFIITKELIISIRYFITVLVIACPCSIGLATPMAIMTGSGRAAENGLLIKNGEVLEILKNIDYIVFDKTGTLTYPELNVTNYIGNIELLKYISEIEKKSNHPIAKAIVKYANNEENIKIDGYENIIGRGINAKIESMSFLIGNIELMKENNINLDAYNEEIEKLLNEYKTIVYISKNNIIEGIIGLKHIIKNDAKYIIEEIKKLNITPIMLTGDNKFIAQYIGRELKIDNIISSVLPNDKANIIEKLQKDNKKVMMVGDGINDAPALVKADIGMAIGNGTDIAIDSADIVLINDNLKDIIKMIYISKYTIINIKENLFWGLIYNIVGVLLATGIFGIRLTPMIAAATMMMSSISVMLNAMRLKYKKIN